MRTRSIIKSEIRRSTHLRSQARIKKIKEHKEILVYLVYMQVGTLLMLGFESDSLHFMVTFL